MMVATDRIGRNPPNVFSPEQLTRAEFNALVGRAEAGCKLALEQLGRHLDEYPVMSFPLGDICRLIEQHLIELASGDSRLQRFAHTQFLTKARNALLSGDDDPMEKFLVHRIVASQLNCTIRRIEAMTPADADRTRRREVLLEQANRHQIECLETFRDFRIKRVQQQLEAFKNQLNVDEVSQTMCPEVGP